MAQTLARVAALIGEASRAAMLMCLVGGERLPAHALARAARITPQTASSHLTKLTAGGLVVCESYGRHRYYRLANAEVGVALEALSTIAVPAPIRSLRESDQARALRFARTCYDHLAGELGVALTDRLLARRFIQEDGRDFVVTSTGTPWFRDFGIDLDHLRRERRHFARQCLDWSERRHHVAGALGAALAQRLLDSQWVERVRDGRSVRITDAGREGLEGTLGLMLLYPSSRRPAESIAPGPL